MAGPVSLLHVLLSHDRQRSEAKQLFGPELLASTPPARPTFPRKALAAYAEAAGENFAAQVASAAQAQPAEERLTLDVLRQKANAARCLDELANLRRRFARLHHPDHARPNEVQSKASAMATANSIIDAAIRRIHRDQFLTQHFARENA